MMITLSTAGITCAAPTPRSMRFCLTFSTIVPSWMPTPSSERTTTPPPSEVAAAVSPRCAARVAVAQTSANASDSTTRVTVVVTRFSSPAAAGAASSPRASCARGGRSSWAMPSNTLEVSSWKSTLALIASMDSSMTSCCTAGSSASGAIVATKASSSTSWTRAQAETIERGTSSVAITITSAERKARHLPGDRRCAGGTAASAGTVRRVSFSVRSRSTSARRSSISDVVMSHLSRGAPPAPWGYSAQPTMRLATRREKSSPAVGDAHARPRAGPRRPCRAPWRRRRGWARTPSCGAAARCGRLAAGRSSRSPRRRASQRRCRRFRRSAASG